MEYSITFKPFNVNHNTHTAALEDKFNWKKFDDNGKIAPNADLLSLFFSYHYVYE